MDNLYCYPGTNVLKNKLFIKDYDYLQQAERFYTNIRNSQLARNPIYGTFDLKHFQAIHGYIFQDIYSWAGDIRKINISKGYTPFANTSYIETYAKDIHKELEKECFLKNYGVDKFSDRLSYYAAEINMLHPFREGNGRATREYLRCLSKEAGYDLNYSKIDYKNLYDAFVSSVTDSIKLKNLFKNHFLDNIKDSYSETYIKNSSESLLSKLNDLRMMFSNGGSCIPINELKNLYKQYGFVVENNPSVESLSKINLISDTLNEIKSEKLREKNSCNELSKEYKKSLDIEL